ncbi:Uncharacterized protein involved in outer membrane biogenesis [Bordetella ansorpii]|uniref:Uncharacterized protein involved in outer membrane biogenesis n=1 Tax=Bordetella ansorpii TaxID=288768 RepID=A0A157PBI2_9BORD|nr:DUF748 domain-containing protein [Bordetella ansorpii]SAI30821.1 Uncharacterized protein involved in outer membrane biogenesis [Bordetella ansorpii]
MPLRVPGAGFGRRIAKVLLILALAVLALSGVSAWLVPYLVRSALTDDVSAMLGRQISVGQVGFNPFTLTLRAHELSIAQPGAAPLLEVVELDVSASWASLVRAAPVVDRVRVSQPKLTLVREDVARFNFSDILQRLAEQAAARPASPPDASLPRFSLNNMVLEGGAISLDDRVTGRRQVVDDLQIGLPFISTFRHATEIDVLPRVHLRVNGSVFELGGTARPFDKTPSYSLNLKFDGLDLEKWADVWPVKLPVKLEKGLLDSNLQVLFEQPADTAPRIRVQGEAGLRGLDLREAGGAPLLAWESLRVQGIVAEPLARTLDVQLVQLARLQAQVHRDAKQQLNWLRVVDALANVGAPSSGAAAPRPPAAALAAAGAPQGTPEAAQAVAKSDAAPAKPAEPPSWKIHVAGIGLTDAAVQVRDEPAGLDYPLGGLSVAIEDVAFPQAASQPIRVWAYMDNPADGSRLRLTTPVTLQPLALDADLKLERLSLAPFAGLVRGQSPVQLLDGRLSAQAHLKLAGTQVSAQNLKVDLANLSLRDEGVTPAIPISLGSLALTADHVALGAQPTAFTLKAAGLQGNASLALQGTLVPQPLSVKTSVDLAGLDLTPFAPYVASSLNATVRSVSVGARGQAEFAAANGATPMRAAWRGALDVNGLNLEDRVNQADFLNWKHLGLSGMDLSLAGERIGANLGDIVLEDFYGSVLLNAEGRLNVLDLVAEPGRAAGSITQDTQTRARESAAAPAARRARAMPDIAIASVTLKRGRMTFNDRFVKPNYSAELSRIEGTVSGVSSTRPAPARVNVGGRVYGSAPFSVSGSVQPFEKFLSLDLKASAKGVDLPRFTTYSAKYVGYPIKRGKLSLDVHYQIKNRALQASNRLVLNQLTFGDKTDSPDAIQLPVLLAVALLKDSQGNIDLNLPVSGSLDDPQFSVGGLVWRVVSNLLVKAVTSPFQLLASAFGGAGEELSFIAFEPGSAELAGDAQQRIETLAKALNDRPSLKLDVTGRADPATDESALRHAWLDAQMRQAKLRDTAGRTSKPDVASVQLSAADRTKYLEKVYDATDLKDKPRNFIGLSKSIPAAQMETMLLDAAPVGPQALRDLAEARAQAVYEPLQAQGPADRIFVVEPRLDAQGIEDGGPPTRVDFSLQ